MPVPGHQTGIAYVEVFAKNAEYVIDRYVNGMFFERAAFAHGRLRHSTLLRSGTCQLIVTTPTSATGPVAEYLSRHGDGVADVALYQADPHATLERAAHAGLTIIEPPHTSADAADLARIAGAGSLQHTLIAAHEPWPLPPGFSWEPGPLHFPTRSGSLTALVRPQTFDHLTLCVPPGELETVAAQYREVLGLDITAYEPVTTRSGTVNTYVLQSPGLTYVLAEPDRIGQPHGSGVGTFLHRHGAAGVQHIAFTTDDIIGAVWLHTRSGMVFAAAPAGHLDRLPSHVSGHHRVRDLRDQLDAAGVRADHDSRGVLFYALMASPHKSGALTYELVQREDASGIGRGDIQAIDDLYTTPNQPRP